jgi:SH2 domain
MAARRSYLSLRLALDAMGDPLNYAVVAQTPVSDTHAAGPSSGLPAAAASPAAATASPSSPGDGSKSQGYVTFERFAKICDAFGPLTPPADFFRRIEVHLQHRWFHPQLSQSAAQSYLLGQNDGTFVVRFSNQPRVPFTLTRVLGGRLYQTRIYRLPDSTYRLGEEHGRWAERRFHSLEEILKSTDVISAFSLKSFVQFQMVSPGQKLLLQPLLDTNYAPDPEPSVVDVGVVGKRGLSCVCG